MNTQQQLSESLLAACKAAGIENPRYIAQDKNGDVWHYLVKPNRISFAWVFGGNEDDTIIVHPPYADHWQDSLLEWVEPQGEPLANVLARHGDLIGDTTEMVILYDIADTSKMIDMQDAIAWKGGGDQASGIEAMVCDDIAKRQQVGIAKYGTTVAENPLTHAQWLQHAYEECLDMAVYLKRAMAEEGGEKL